MPTCNVYLEADEEDEGDDGDAGNYRDDVEILNDGNEEQYDDGDYGDSCEEVLESFFLHVTEIYGRYDWRGFFGNDEQPIDVEDIEDENGRDVPIGVSALEDDDILDDGHGWVQLKEAICSTAAGDDA